MPKLVKQTARARHRGLAILLGFGSHAIAVLF